MVVVCTVWSCKHCVKAVKPFRKRSGIVRSAETVALAATAVALSATALASPSPPSGGGGSERVVNESSSLENLQRGLPPQGRCEGHQRRVGDGGVV